MTVMPVVFRLTRITKVVLTEKNLLHIVNNIVITTLTAKVMLKLSRILTFRMVGRDVKLPLLLLVGKGVKSTTVVLTRLLFEVVVEYMDGGVDATSNKLEVYNYSENFQRDYINILSTIIPCLI